MTHLRQRMLEDMQLRGLSARTQGCYVAELSPRTLWTFLRELSSLRRTPRIVREELSGVSEPPMIIRMTSTSRPQQRYDHRLRDLVQRTGDLTIATDLGVPRSTARGWLGAAPTVVVSLEVANLTEPELRQEILKLRRRVEKPRRCSGWRSPCYTPPGSGSQESVCRTDTPSCESCAPWIGRASMSRCERSSGSCVCRRVGFRPGADGRPRVRSTISRRALGRHRID
jgi:hypothetical protein